VEVYYPVQIFKAPLCEVENQRINENKKDTNKIRSRRKSVGRFSEEKRRIGMKNFYFYGFTTPVFSTSHYQLRVSHA